MYTYLLSLVGLSVPVLLWYYIGNFFYYLYNHDFKISRNIASFIHASSVILFYNLNINYNALILYYISRGYYLIDTLYELVTYKTASTISVYQLGMLLHHVVTLFSIEYLLYPNSVKYVFYCYYLAELSNLPMYLMRHLNSLKVTNKYLLGLILVSEFVSYIVLRMIMCIPIMYKVYYDSNIDNTLKSMTIIMYCISGYWSYKLFGQIHKNISYNKTI